MKRWLLLSAGIAMAAGALYVVARPASAPPEGRIGAASRAKLEQVLREADRPAPPSGARRADR